MRYVLNRAPKFTDLSAKARVKRMAESLDIDIEVQLPDGGEQVTQANDHGLPIAENAAKNPLRKELQKLAKSLVRSEQICRSRQGADHRQGNDPCLAAFKKPIDRAGRRPGAPSAAGRHRRADKPASAGRAPGRPCRSKRPPPRRWPPTRRRSARNA